MGYLAEKGIISQDAQNTADVILFFDKLFDSINGSFGKRKHSKPLLGPATPNSLHHKTWMEAKIFLKNMKFVNIKTSNVEYVPTLNHVLVLMVKGLRKKFKQPIAYYFTNALNKAQLKDIFKKNVSYVRSTGLKVVCD
ncbi:hypothetical protein SFRURICE_001257 [Spodoptera frugiperda]|nr:hypothetical protein SFRURICE_001257 [Spodoptera frugiperda]